MGKKRTAETEKYRYAWYVTALLTAAYVISIIDRQLLSVLIESVKTTVHLTDFQAGLLLGPAFAAFYVTLGVPFGWLADRYSRKTIAAAGMALWCLMTAATGLATSFSHLLLARLGVGVGEAALSPSAISLIGDMFPPAQRARAISTYMTALFIGAGLAFTLSGPMIALLKASPEFSIPLAGTLEPWQAAFVLVGIPGLLIASLLATIQEPARPWLTRQERPLTETKSSERSDALPFLRSQWRAVGTVLAGMTGVIAVSSATVWLPAVFARTWRWSLSEIGLSVGLIFIVAGIPGAAFGGWLADRRVRRGSPDGAIQVAILGSCIMFPAAAIFPLMPSGTAALIPVYLLQLGNAIATAAGPAALMAVTPPALRARMTATYFMVTNLIGLFIGPSLVGALTDFAADPRFLGKALAIVVMIFGVPGILAFVVGRAAFARAASKELALSSAPLTLAVH